MGSWLAVHAELAPGRDTAVTYSCRFLFHSIRERPVLFLVWVDPLSISQRDSLFAINIMAVNPQTAVLALDGGDPRLNDNADNVVPAETYSRRDVSFEEYMYYAAITRAEEKEANARYIEARGPKSFKKIVGARFSRGHASDLATVTPNESVEEKPESDNGAQVTVQRQHYITPSQEKMTSRAIRTASWGTIFYLITTDILGPTGAPYVLSLFASISKY